MNYTLKKKKATPLPPKNPKHTTKKTTTKKHKGKLLTKKQEFMKDIWSSWTIEKQIKKTLKPNQCKRG